MKRSSPAAQRNREPILAALRARLPERGEVLEIASGTGEHAVHFAGALPALSWQPSDVDAVALASIAAWRRELGLPNLREPMLLDVTAPSWQVQRAEAVYCANMIHIAPWVACRGLFAGAARVLAADRRLFTYGPYRFAGETAPSNLAFDASLRQRDPQWGVRDIVELEQLADEHGLHLEETVAMPANNHLLVFRRR
jgi:Protein of unknown function (DUF938)